MTKRRIYQEIYPYFVSINIKDKNCFFVESEYGESLYEIIIFSCKAKGFVLYAFCILADHLHILVKKDPSATAEGRAVECSKNITTVKDCAVSYSRNTTQSSVPALWKEETISSLIHSHSFF